MTKQIDKTIIGKTYPKDTNVHWIDTSGEEPVSKYFINGKWRTIAGGGNNEPSDPGYTVTKSYVIVDEETLTTNPGEGFVVGFQNYFQLVYGKTYIVTYNGVKYKCVANKDYECVWIGGYNEDFSEYPFQIAYFFNEEDALLFAEAPDTYTIKIELEIDDVETTPEFKQAVNSVTDGITPVNILELPCFKPMSEWYPFNSNPKISDILADGFSLVTGGNSSTGYFYIAQTIDENTVPYELPNDIQEKCDGFWANCTPVFTAYINYYLSDWEIEYINSDFGFGYHSDGMERNSVYRLMPTYLSIDEEECFVLGASWSSLVI